MRRDGRIVSGSGLRGLLSGRSGIKYTKQHLRYAISTGDARRVHGVRSRGVTAREIQSGLKEVGLTVFEFDTHESEIHRMLAGELDEIHRDAADRAVVSDRLIVGRTQI